MRLDEGWNQIQFNLSDFTRRAYGTNYIETLRYVRSHARLPLFWCFCCCSARATLLGKPTDSFWHVREFVENANVYIGYKSTPTVESGEFTSQTDSIRKMNYLLSSNYSYQLLQIVILLEVVPLQLIIK